MQAHFLLPGYMCLSLLGYEATWYRHHVALCLDFICVPVLMGMAYFLKKKKKKKKRLLI